MNIKLIASYLYIIDNGTGLIAAPSICRNLNLYFIFKDRIS